MQNDGTCEACPDFHIAARDGKICINIKDLCLEDEIVSVEGNCIWCDAYTYADQKTNACISDTCLGRSYLEEDGKCQECPASTTPSLPDRMKCIKVCEDESCEDDAIKNDFLKLI